MKDLCGNCFGK